MATTEEVRADLAEIVNEVAGVPADDVQLDKSFADFSSPFALSLSKGLQISGPEPLDGSTASLRSHVQYERRH